MHESERLHSFDAVRAFALLAGIVLHVAWPFLPGQADAGWALADQSSSVPLAVLFYTIHIFRMALFFLIAGFFGRALLHSRGVKGFCRDRMMRILVPLVVGWLVLYPFILAAFAWPAMKSNGFLLPKLPTFFNSRWSFPLAHLWFLYYLLLMYGAALAGRWTFIHLVDRRGRLRQRMDDWLAHLIASGWAALVLAVLPACALFLNAEWFPWFGVATPDTSLRPTAPATLTLGTAFTLGWWFNRRMPLLRHWERHWISQLAAALVLTIASLALVGVTPTHTAAAHDGSTLIYALIYMTAAWSWSFAVLGAASKYCAAPSAVRRYAADASYWMYLVHLPAVLLIQAALQDRPWHWGLKFALNLSVTLSLLLASYHFLVRFTIIGRVLNGRRHPRALRLPALTRYETSE